jgi:hypothetical protein
MASINDPALSLPLPTIDFDWDPIGGALAYNFVGNSYPPSGDPRFAAYYTPIGQVITFTAHVLSVSDEAPIVQYRWDLGDGTVKFGSEVSHTYVVPNPSTAAALEVTDSLNRKVYVSHGLLLQVQFEHVDQVFHGVPRGARLLRREAHKILVVLFPLLN